MGWDAYTYPCIEIQKNSYYFTLLLFLSFLSTFILNLAFDVMFTGSIICPIAICRWNICHRSLELS